MYQTTLVAEGHVAADEDVVGNGLPEDLDTEDVGDDLLCLALKIGVNEGDVVVGDDDVTERRQTLLYALNLDLVW